MIKSYFIVGLGMIGSSYAKRLSDLGQVVYGYDIDESTNKLAVELGYIKDYGLHLIKEVDAVILTLYPYTNIKFIKDNIELLKDVKYLTDVSGVKRVITKDIKEMLKDTIYISHHPMAGSEKSGINACNPNIFNDANFLIITNSNTKEEGINFLVDLANKLNFRKPTLIDEITHDKMISFTSQLPHLIASALVNSDIYEDTTNFTGDSYKDLTRIANINESLWLELFNANKDYLINDLKRFSDNLNDVLKALENNNDKELEKLLTTAKEKRKTYDKNIKR